VEREQFHGGVRGRCGHSFEREVLAVNGVREFECTDAQKRDERELIRHPSNDRRGIEKQDNLSDCPQSSGVCLSGPHAGGSPTVRPAATMTWDAFTGRYPGGDPRLRTSIDDWPFAFHAKTLTLGLTVGDEPRGYPRMVVKTAGGVVADTPGGIDVVVVAAPAGLFAYEHDGLDFEATADGSRFRADGTAWDAATGGRSHGFRAAGCSRSPGGTITALTRSTGRDLMADQLFATDSGHPVTAVTAAEMRAVDSDAPVVSLDVLTGRDATTGEQPGPAVDPERVVTLALPKTGLAGLSCRVVLADIVIPGAVYERLDIPYESVFAGEYLVDLVER